MGGIAYLQGYVSAYANRILHNIIENILGGIKICVRKDRCRTGLYWLDGKSGLSACQFGLYRNAAGFQRIDVTEDADLSLPDAGHSKSYAGYGAAASLF